MDAFSLCSLHLGRWVKVVLPSPRSNKEHMTCVVCYLSVCSGGFPLNAFIFWNFGSGSYSFGKGCHASIFVWWARREGQEQCKCHVLYPAGSQLPQRGSAPLAGQAELRLLCSLHSVSLLPGGCGLKVIKKLWGGSALKQIPGFSVGFFCIKIGCSGVKRIKSSWVVGRKSIYHCF